MKMERTLNSDMLEPQKWNFSSVWGHFDPIIVVSVDCLEYCKSSNVLCLRTTHKGEKIPGTLLIDPMLLF